jgi:hypothetical protein
MMTGTLMSKKKKDTPFPGGMGVSCSWLYLGRGWSNAVSTFVIRHPTYLERLQLAMH